LSFKKIIFPNDYEYSSDKENLPLEFYLEVLPRAKTIYLKLGYFSSSAIRVLAYGFAQFIFNGGNINIVSNHFLRNKDKELLDITPLHSNEIDLNDLDKIKSHLTDSEEHFFNCLKYLAVKKRLKIVPVMLLPERMAHYKQGIFVDYNDNEIFMDGSCNFTGNGLTENGETISVYRSWGSSFEKRKIVNKRESIDSIINKTNSGYKYLDKADIVEAIHSLGQELPLESLLEDERKLLLDIHNIRIKNIIRKHEKLLDEKIKAIKKSPKFPFSSGPREYQKTAYLKWKESQSKGVFAMATGTGKTITALNCVLEEFVNDNTYQFIVLVPSKVLIKQWKSEVRAFNFTEIVTVSSEFPHWKSELTSLNNALYFDNRTCFGVLVTYASFVKESFQNLINNFPANTILIADEAHNIGSKGFRPLLPTLKFERRLALSATLKRYFDDEGDKAIQSFFNSLPPYTYSFSMAEAIRQGILCDYLYYPHIVRLNEDELERYVEISKTLIKFFDFESQTFKNTDIVEKLLLARKRIIHKAVNKLAKFKHILKKQNDVKGSFKYTFVYVPEGSNEDGNNILDEYLGAFEDSFPAAKAYAYTSESPNKDQIMELFESGVADVLFSMKCLDEGVDVPRAELAIFCSSTGNPRQFVQRRGRVLRSHPDKKKAVIHDLIVAPQFSEDESTFLIEKKLVKDELTRVVYFASLANNYYEGMQVCNEIAQDYGLDLFSMHDDLSEKL
jgi:superfamily II DNA or RNA helicase